MGRWRHIKAIIVLPVMVTVVIPILLLLSSINLKLMYIAAFPFNYLQIVLGCAIAGLGLFLLIKTNLHFATIGKGTLAPWDPPQKFVAVGIYRHVRNPMIIGVILILLGEAVLFGAVLVFIWAIAFLCVNHIFFIKVEEPALARRFESDYLRYKESVPRWIPRLKPWTGLLSENQTNSQ